MFYNANSKSGRFTTMANIKKVGKGRKQKVAKPPVRFQNLHYKNQIFGSNGLVSSHYALFFDEELKIRQNVHQVDTLVVTGDW